VSAPPSPSLADLRDLVEKYRTLSGLRDRRDEGGEGPTPATLRELATKHPGCLRELDTLGFVELQRRARAVTAVTEGGPPEPWMAWIWAYHRLMQATLLVKRAIVRGVVPAGEAGRLAREATRLAGWPLDEAFVAEVARPPQGRLGVVVLRRLARLYGVPATELARTLFPPRRPSPYTLEE
jgi:hypothetical protein